MTDLAYLAAMSDAEFDIERERIIKAAIESAPAEYRDILRRQQALIDGVDREDRVLQIIACMNEALENLSDQIQAFKNLQR